MLSVEGFSDTLSDDEGAGNTIVVHFLWARCGFSIETSLGLHLWYPGPG